MAGIEWWTVLYYSTYQVSLLGKVCFVKRSPLFHSKDRAIDWAEDDRESWERLQPGTQAGPIFVHKNTTVDKGPDGFSAIGF